MREVAAVQQKDQPTPIEPGHGCWGGNDPVVAILTTTTQFGDFWRRTYPDDEGSGLTAMTVEKTTAQLFERLILEDRYYAVRVGSQWTAA